MSLRIRRQVHVTRHSWVNVSKSGLSLSAREGRVTANTRKNLFIRIAKGIFWVGRL